MRGVKDGAVLPMGRASSSAAPRPPSAPSPAVPLLARFSAWPTGFTMSPSLPYALPRPLANGATMGPAIGIWPTPPAAASPIMPENCGGGAKDGPPGALPFSPSSALDRRSPSLAGALALGDHMDTEGPGPSCSPAPTRGSDGSDGPTKSSPLAVQPPSASMKPPASAPGAFTSGGSCMAIIMFWRRMDGSHSSWGAPSMSPPPARMSEPTAEPMRGAMRASMGAPRSIRPGSAFLMASIPPPPPSMPASPSPADFPIPLMAAWFSGLSMYLSHMGISCGAMLDSVRPA